MAYFKKNQGEEMPLQLVINKAEGLSGLSSMLLMTTAGHVTASSRNVL